MERYNKLLSRQELFKLRMISLKEHDKQEELKMQVDEKRKELEEEANHQLKVEHDHPHIDECGVRDSFEMALKSGHLIVIEGELQIQGRLPDGAKVGNVITNEKYDPGQFHFNMIVSYCPFCGKRIDN